MSRRKDGSDPFVFKEVFNRNSVDENQGNKLDFLFRDDLRLGSVPGRPLVGKSKPPQKIGAGTYDIPPSKEQPHILALPRSLRLRLWRYAGYKSTRDLRLTCSKILEDIDHYFGISFVVNELEFDIEDVFEEIGIRHATIVTLPSQNTSTVLQHPELLAELSIHGPISTAYFRYFMKSCPNISRLSIVYDKGLLKLKPELFPQPLILCLPALKALRFVAHAKKEKDIIYICNTLTGLIKDTLTYNRQMIDLHFSLSHKCPSPYLQELVLEILVFAHKNCKSLQEFHLNIKEKDPNVAGAQTQEEDNSGQRRGTEMVQRKKSQKAKQDPVMPPSDSSSYSEMTNFKADRKNSDLLDMAEKYLKTWPWPILPYLKKVNVAANSVSFQYLEKMLYNSKHLISLQVEINGGTIINCWLAYQRIVSKIGQNLTCIKLLGVSYEDFLMNALDIDFSAFSDCKSLRKLHFSCQSRELNLLPKARNITNLPKKSLEELELSWVTLTSWQMYKLFRSFRKLDKLSVSYSTASEDTFACFLKTFRWLHILKMTKIQIFSMTDFKIKFRNKRTVIKNLEKSVPIQIEYLDREETLLIIDRGQSRRDSQTSIPSISSE